MTLSVPRDEAAKELGFDSIEQFEKHVQKNKGLPYIIQVSERKWIVSRSLLERYFDGQFFEEKKRRGPKPKLI